MTRCQRSLVALTSLEVHETNAKVNLKVRSNQPDDTLRVRANPAGRSDWNVSSTLRCDSSPSASLPNARFYLNTDTCSQKHVYRLLLLVE